MDIPHPYELLTDDENIIIHKTRNLRLDMLNRFIEEKGIPTSTRDMRVINEIAKSLDEQVLGLVDRRLKNEENKVNGNMLEMAKEILSRTTDDFYVENKKELDLRNEFVPTDVVPGETTLEYEEIDPDEILN